MCMSACLCMCLSMFCCMRVILNMALSMHIIIMSIFDKKKFLALLVKFIHLNYFNLVVRHYRTYSALK